MEGATIDPRVRRHGPAASDDHGRREAGGVTRRMPPSTARMALGLGLLGVGLGLAELLAPRRLARLIGVRDRPRTRALTRTLGVRELLSGLGLLGRRRPAPWLWSRVAGDAMDLALLGTAARRREARDRHVGTAIATVVAATALDLYAAVKATGRERTEEAGPVRRTVTIAVTPERAYDFWRALPNLPRFMPRLESVEELGAGRSRWRVRGPLGKTLQWEAEIVDERPNERLRWRSVAGAEVSHHGEVRFRPAPGRRGVEVTVDLSYLPPGGELGRAAAFFSTEAIGIELERDLQRLKQLLELGEIVQSDASAHPGRHAAQPSRT